MKRVIKLLLSLLAVAFICVYALSRRYYMFNYFRVIGLSKSGIGNFTTSDAIDYFGNPDRMEETADETGEYHFADLYYDGFSLIFVDSQWHRRVQFTGVKITGVQYYVGWRRLHVGSTREQVIQAYEYANVKNINGYASGEGYSDFYTHVYYEYDENDRVQEIRIAG